MDETLLEFVEGCENSRQLAERDFYDKSECGSLEAQPTQEAIFFSRNNHPKLHEPLR